jgi:hypothetical protein
MMTAGIASMWGASGAPRGGRRARRQHAGTFVTFGLLGWILRQLTGR